MKYLSRSRMLTKTVCFLVVLTLNAAAQTNEFTYQGLVKEGGTVLNGNYDFELRLFPQAVGGSPISALQKSNVLVDNGVFSVILDFGLFPTADRYLEVAVRRAGDPTFVTLSPRNKILSVPVATRAVNSSFASNASNADTLGGLPPTSFIANSTSGQVGNFNISGTGSADILNVQTKFTIRGETFISSPGSWNLFFGTNAGIANNNGTENTFVGIDAGKSNTVGGSNSFFGAWAGTSNQGGIWNSFFGQEAGKANVGGSGNSFFGARSGSSNTSGSGNAFFGRDAGVGNTTGTRNSFFGNSTGFNNTTGNDNAFFGTGSSSGSNSTGSRNVYIGRDAGSTTSSGNENVAIGYNAGLFNLSGSGNIALGSFANFSVGSTPTNATAIGYRAVAARSNSIVLGGISGVNLGTDTNVGIGTTAPLTKLHVAGGDVYVAAPNSVILTSPNGACWKLSVSDAGLVSAVSTPCP